LVNKLYNTKIVALFSSTNEGGKFLRTTGSRLFEFIAHYKFERCFIVLCYSEKYFVPKFSNASVCHFWPHSTDEYFESQHDRIQVFSQGLTFIDNSWGVGFQRPKKSQGDNFLMAHSEPSARNITFIFCFFLNYIFFFWSEACYINAL